MQNSEPGQGYIGLGMTVVVGFSNFVKFQDVRISLEPCTSTLNLPTSHLALLLAQKKFISKKPRRGWFRGKGRFIQRTPKKMQKNMYPSHNHPLTEK